MKFIYIVTIDCAEHAFFKRENALQLLENMGVRYADAHRYISQIRIYDSED
jgi:hypothetical protein